MKIIHESSRIVPLAAVVVFASACAYGAMSPEGADLSAGRASIPGEVAPPNEGGMSGAQLGSDRRAEDGGAVDGGLLAKDGGGLVQDGGASDGSLSDALLSDGSLSDASLSTCVALVINEIATAGVSASDEFVEIYNPTMSACDVRGWKLVYRSASGINDVTLFSGGTFTLAAHGFAVIGGADFSGAADGSLANGLAANGGQLQLRMADGTVTSSVGYGSATGAFVQGAPALASDATHSIGRIPDGKDSQDNAADFAVLVPSPGTPNK